MFHVYVNKHFHASFTSLREAVETFAYYTSLGIGKERINIVQGDVCHVELPDDCDNIIV